MNINWLKFYWFIFLFVNIPVLLCNEQIHDKLVFESITIKNGLSSNIINTIYIDKKGYLWIGNDNGLNRYNGYTVTSYKHNPADSTTIGIGYVTNILEDDNNNLWVATKNGVSIFNYNTEKFVNKFNAEILNTIVTRLYRTTAGEMLIVTRIGVYKYMSQLNTFERYFTSKIDSFSNILVQDSIGHYIIGTWGQGIVIFSKDRTRYSRINVSDSHYRSNIIEDITIGSDGKIWILSQNCLNELQIIDDGKNLSGKLISHLKLNDLESSFRKFNSLIIDNGAAWIGTQNGLIKYTINSVTCNYIVSEGNNKSLKSLSNNHITCLYKTKTSDLFIGTYQGGVNYHSKTIGRFSDEFPEVNNNKNLLIKYVKSINQDLKGEIWVGTDYGILRYSKDYKLIKTYTQTGSTGSLREGGVNSILTDKAGNKWIGLWGGGFFKYIKENDSFKSLSKKKINDNFNINLTDPKYSGELCVKTILQDKKGTIWIAYIFGILDLFDPQKEEFIHYHLKYEIKKPNLLITDMVSDDSGNLWFGSTGAGLIKFSINDNKFKLYKLPSTKKGNNYFEQTSTDVYSLYYDGNIIWLGTGNGLESFNPATEKFENFSTKWGLTQSTITGVKGDNKGNIWMSTLNGITQYNKARGFFINYDETDGVLPNADFGYRNNENKLFFAGVNGITSFYPDSIFGATPIPPLVFSDFKLFNQSIPIGSDILPKHINEIDEIKLTHNQNVFSIELAALNYNQSYKNEYKCLLQGFDKDWVFLGSSREIKYTNLEPGTYYFRAKASNNEGLWNDKGRTLKIIILPPWWKTIYFKILIIFLVISSIIGYIRLKTRKLRLQNEKLFIKVKERTREIEHQKELLNDRANELNEINTILVDKQEEITVQKKEIEATNLNLEIKNNQLEKQKEQLLRQKNQVEEMSAKIHEADQIKLRFFTNVSHEFRTPLTLISGPIENAIKEAEKVNEIGILNNLRLAHQNSNRLLRLINQVLDISKIDAGLIKLKVEKGLIYNFVSSIIEVNLEYAFTRGIVINFESNLKDFECFFDADKLEKILYNLLSNSIKYTPSGKNINVSLNNTSQLGEGELKPYIRLVVADEGVGIDNKHKQLIFQRFYQIDEAKQLYSGTGIGLSLTKELIDVYRGQIQLQSEIGQGTTFVVKLPYREEDFTDQEIMLENETLQLFYGKNSHQTHSELPLIDDNFKTSNPTILIVDDNDDILTFLYNNLKDNFKISFATDGIQGFEKATTILPQLIISDVMMPNSNGYELCKQLKLDERTCHIPVILLSAKANIDDQAEGIMYGADDYITKPFDLDLLKLKAVNLITSRAKLKKIFIQNAIVPENISINSPNDKLLKRIIKTLEENISDCDFGVEELSKAVGLSRMHLYRKLNDLVQLSPVEFIRNFRLQRSAQLLLQKKVYVSEVSYLCGFQEISYFRKIFKEYYGQSPSEYANKIQELDNTEPLIGS